MNTTLILLKDGRNILVDRSKYAWVNEYYLDENFEIKTPLDDDKKYYENRAKYPKIIAGIEPLPTLTYSDEVKQELRDKYGWVDVEELAKEYLKSLNIKDTLYDASKDDGSWIKGGLSKLIINFKAHQSITNKMFSLEDVVKAIELAREGNFNNYDHFGYVDWDNNKEQIIQSLQQPIQLNVEVEMEGCVRHISNFDEIITSNRVLDLETLEYYGNRAFNRPKITNNSILITKILD